MPEERVVVDGELRVERSHLALGRHDERVDLAERRVAGDEGLVQLSDDRHDLLLLGRILDAGLIHEPPRVPRVIALERVDVQPDERVRARRGDLLDVHATLRREHEERLLRAAIERDREVVLARDLRGALDPHLLDRVAANVHAEDLRRSLLRLVRRLCELDAAGLAAAAREHLRLDDDRPAELLRGGARLCRARRKPTLRHGDSEAAEELLPLEFVQVQSAGESTRQRVAPRRSTRVCEHGTMSRTTILVLVALGAALAGFAFSSAAKRLQDDEPAAEASVAARPQSASLDWRETHGTPGEHLVFSVDSLQVTRHGWRAKRGAREPVLGRVRAGRSTGDVEPLVRGHAVLDGEDRGAERAERQQHAPGRAPRGALRAEPCRRSSSPMRRGRGRSRRRGHSPPGSWVRVVFGTLVSVGNPPEELGESSGLDHRSRVPAPLVAGRSDELRRRAERRRAVAARARRRSSPGRRGRRSPRRSPRARSRRRPRNRTTEPSTAASRRSAISSSPRARRTSCSAACTASVVARPPPVVIELDPSRQGALRHGNGVLRIHPPELEPARQDEHVRREAVAALVRREPEIVLARRVRRARGRPPSREARSIRRGSRDRRRGPASAARPRRRRRDPRRRGRRDARARSGAPPRRLLRSDDERDGGCRPDRPGRRMKSSARSWRSREPVVDGFVGGPGRAPGGRYVAPPRSRNLDEQEPLGGRRGRRERLVRGSREIGAPHAREAHVGVESVSMTQIRSPWATCSPGRTQSPLTTPAPMGHDLVLHLHRLDDADQRLRLRSRHRRRLQPRGSSPASG